MAKKSGKTSGSAASKGMVVQHSMKRQKPKPSTLLDALDMSDMKDTSRKRELRRRNTDETIRKKVRDNFPGFTESELSLNQVGGFNVYERIRRDMDRTNSGERAGRMGKLYYEQLREMYRDPESPLSLLTIKNMTETVDPALERALCALLATKKSTFEIHQWAENVPSVSQMNVVALFRQLLKLPPGKSLENANIAVSVLKLCARLGLHQLYPGEWKAVKPHMDLALVRTLAAFKTEAQTTTAWWAIHADFAKLILPEASMNKVLSTSSSWQTVQAEVLEIYESSAVGRRMMCRAVRQLEVESVGLHVAKAMTAISKVPNITKAALEDNRKEFLKALKATGTDPTKPFVPRKEAEIIYRGVPVRMVVTSAADHYGLALEAFLRGVAAELELVPSLWCEADLVEAKRALTVTTIEASLLKAAKASRQACLDSLSDEFATSQNIENVFKTKKSFLGTVDRFIRIEMSFWQGCTGESAGERVKALVLSCLPEVGGDVRTLSESVTLFQTAADSKLLSFAGPSHQAMFKSVHEWILAMASGRNPEVEKGGSTGFIVKVKERMAMFMRYNDLVGKAAAVAKFNQLMTDPETQQPLAPSYAELVPLLSFQWLLDAGARSQLLAAVKRAVKASGSHKSAGDDPDDGARPSSSKRPKTDAKAMVKALFAK